MLARGSHYKVEWTFWLGSTLNPKKGSTWNSERTVLSMSFSRMLYNKTPGCIAPSAPACSPPQRSYKWWTAAVFVPSPVLRTQRRLCVRALLSRCCLVCESAMATSQQTAYADEPIRAAPFFHSGFFFPLLNWQLHFTPAVGLTLKILFIQEMIYTSSAARTWTGPGSSK